MLPTQGAQFDPWSGNQIPHATAKSNPGLIGTIFENKAEAHF